MPSYYEELIEKKEKAFWLNIRRLIVLAAVSSFAYWLWAIKGNPVLAILSVIVAGIAQKIFPTGMLGSVTNTTNMTKRNKAGHPGPSIFTKPSKLEVSRLEAPPYFAKEEPSALVAKALATETKNPSASFSKALEKAKKEPSASSAKTFALGREEPSASADERSETARGKNPSASVSCLTSPLTGEVDRRSGEGDLLSNSSLSDLANISSYTLTRPLSSRERGRRSSSVQGEEPSALVAKALATETKNPSASSTKSPSPDLSRQGRGEEGEPSALVAKALATETKNPSMWQFRGGEKKQKDSSSLNIKKNVSGVSRI